MKKKLLTILIFFLQTWPIQAFGFENPISFVSLKIGKIAFSSIILATTTAIFLSKKNSKKLNLQHSISNLFDKDGSGNFLIEKGLNHLDEEALFFKHNNYNVFEIKKDGLIIQENDNFYSPIILLLGRKEERELVYFLNLRTGFICTSKNGSIEIAKFGKDKVSYFVEKKSTSFPETFMQNAEEKKPLLTDKEKARNLLNSTLNNCKKYSKDPKIQSLAAIAGIATTLYLFIPKNTTPKSPLEQNLIEQIEDIKPSELTSAEQANTTVTQENTRLLS